MSEENLQPGENKRDLMDGGFAVVDREKIIEEETRVITPWYMHFINVFFSPRKMMEENFYQDPPKGMGIAIIGSLLFTVIAVILTLANPIQKSLTFDQLRMSGVAEEMLGQQYAIAQVVGVIGAVVAIFVVALFTAVAIQIIKAILKDKGKFGSLYVVALLSQMVGAAVLCIDRLIAMFIPTANTVLGAASLVSEETLTSNLPLAALLNVPSLQFVAASVILIIGYSVVTRASIVKSTAVIISIQAFFTLLGVGYMYFVQMMMQSMQIPM